MITADAVELGGYPVRVADARSAAARDRANVRDCPVEAVAVRRGDVLMVGDGWFNQRPALVTDVHAGAESGRLLLITDEGTLYPHRRDLVRKVYGIKPRVAEGGEMPNVHDDDEESLLVR